MFFVRNNCTCVYMLLVFIYSASDVQKCFLVLLLVHRHDKHYCSTWIFPAWMASIENPNISMYSLLRYQPNWKGLHVQSMMLICDIYCHFVVLYGDQLWQSVATRCSFWTWHSSSTLQYQCSGFIASLEFFQGFYHILLSWFLFSL